MLCYISDIYRTLAEYRYLTNGQRDNILQRHSISLSISH